MIFDVFRYCVVLYFCFLERYFFKLLLLNPVREITLLKACIFINIHCTLQRITSQQECRRFKTCTWNDAHPGGDVTIKHQYAGSKVFHLPGKSNTRVFTFTNATSLSTYPVYDKQYKIPPGYNLKECYILQI